MSYVAGVDPRTAKPLPAVTEETTDHQVDTIAGRAAPACAGLEAMGRQGRGELLDAMAEAVERHRDELVDIATLETGFATSKLDAELTRAAYQLRFFADVIRDGGYLEATIDRAGTTPMGPRPDLRRLLVPIGPVAVFGASNFPFAFSVLGGDTASALAAGCPVVVKAHASHPATSRLSFDVLVEAAAQMSAPESVLGIVYGRDAGTRLVAHPAIRAVGFTGSLSGGEVLMDIINRRPDPIPFYGELSSLNPVIVTPLAAAERGEAIGAELVTSFTLGAGQLCTKPGLVLVPDNADGDGLVRAVREALADVAPAPLLNERIFESYFHGTHDLRRRPHLSTVGDTDEELTADGFTVGPIAFETDIANLHEDLVTEIFGPVTVLVRYSAAEPEAATSSALAILPHSLTATIVHGADEDTLVSRLTDIARPAAGRIVYNGFPTGVAVSWAQTHGGPWPSTNSLHTSVGATAIRRFLRPVTYQNAPESVLPEELRDGSAAFPRRIDGVLTLPADR
ncbi:aldehyde dehydrogenase [Mycobacterium sp. 852013-50091_SCH5140682]|uniref:aldehyde dehydrogenase (NADP(+)) n=1 Tax=Mycobacterium sp. 852013-50091_SCH5140682 TaxID=1834109 RepID=UPI0007EA6895|nr:aldehyde dehydrogenase (NADP(+)) [Mycobacterium sp. 852013-50091_SCH5140682]OBC17470.1 aldehyde dehydrogenase [Mycobacterium sp. 852013-50091_SCH5140682]